MQTPQSLFLVGVAAFLFCFTSTASGQQGKSIPSLPTFVASREAVQEGQTIQYGCNGFKYDSKTAVSFFSNEARLFDSTTNKTVSGVTKINATAITLSGAFISKDGLKRAYCIMNSTSSYITEVIPYISKISLSLTPKTFKVGTPFNVSCSLSVLPTSFAYNVTFYRNDKQFGLWARAPKTGIWAWANNSDISGGSVAPGVKTPPPFSVVVTPTKKDAAGRYRCVAVLPVGKIGKTATFPSGTLSNGAAPTSAMIAFVMTFAASVLAVIR